MSRISRIVSVPDMAKRWVPAGDRLAASLCIWGIGTCERACPLARRHPVARAARSGETNRTRMVDQPQCKFHAERCAARALLLTKRTAHRNVYELRVQLFGGTGSLPVRPLAGARVTRGCGGVDARNFFLQFSTIFPQLIFCSRFLIMSHGFQVPLCDSWTCIGGQPFPCACVVGALYVPCAEVVLLKASGGLVRAPQFSRNFVQFFALGLDAP